MVFDFLGMELIQIEANLAKVSLMSQEPKRTKQLLPKGEENSSACLRSP